MNLNKIFVLGNVTRDPEVRALPSGQQLTTFGLATNRFYTDSLGQKKQDVEFHNVVAFGKMADIGSRYLKKGSLVLVEGRIKTRSWQNQQGLKQYRTEIICENIQLGPRPLASNSHEQTAESPAQKNEEIPIIEENYTPPSPVESQENPSPENPGDPEIKQVSFEKDNSEEIDIKDIPF